VKRFLAFLLVLTALALALAAFDPVMAMGTFTNTGTATACTSPMLRLISPMRAPAASGGGRLCAMATCGRNGARVATGGGAFEPLLASSNTATCAVAESSCGVASARYTGVIDLDVEDAGRSAMAQPAPGVGQAGACESRMRSILKRHFQ
jgi:hypothetical protein